MRYRFLFEMMLAAAALSACGGSSSETPPPLQPDPIGFRYASTTPTPVRVVEESDAGKAPETIPEPTLVDPKPRVPARSTWGSGAAAH
jgi:hypothetical protein